MYVYIYIYICMYAHTVISHTMMKISIFAASSIVSLQSITAFTSYTRSPLEDSRLFGPSPWKILATAYEQMGS